jgi:hypothetical protein
MRAARPTNSAIYHRFGGQDASPRYTDHLSSDNLRAYRAASFARASAFPHSGLTPLNAVRLKKHPGFSRALTSYINNGLPCTCADVPPCSHGGWDHDRHENGLKLRCEPRLAIQCRRERHNVTIPNFTRFPEASVFLAICEGRVRVSCLRTARAAPTLLSVGVSLWGSYDPRQCSFAAKGRRCRGVRPRSMF